MAAKNEKMKYKYIYIYIYTYISYFFIYTTYISKQQGEDQRQSAKITHN